MVEEQGSGRLRISLKVASVSKLLYEREGLSLFSLFTEHCRFDVFALYLSGFPNVGFPYE